MSLVTFGLFIVAIVLVALLVVDLSLSLPGWRKRRESRRRNHVH